MRLIRNSLATLILLGVVAIIGLRVTASFRHKREFTSKLPFLQKIVTDLQASDSKADPALVKVPVPEEALGMVHSILAQRPAEGSLAVEFVTRGGFPVKHRGFLFLSSGRIEDFPAMAARWPKRTPLREHWLYIGD